jgi:uncharacterized protein involved in response to NO
MFSTVRRFIKTGIGFLVAGLLLGGYLLLRRELFGVWPNRYLVSAHVHAVGIGFIIFLILGVALWLFPRAAKDSRYNPALIDAAYWILALSTLTRFVAEAARAFVDHPTFPVAIVASGFGQIFGIGLYFYTMWPRIRPVGSHLREAAGERF